MAKKINGYTAWVVVGLTVLAMYTTTVVWGIRLEGKTNINEEKIKHVDKHIGEINEKMDIILEKL